MKKVEVREMKEKMNKSYIYIEKKSKILPVLRDIHSKCSLLKLGIQSISNSIQDPIIILKGKPILTIESLRYYVKLYQSKCSNILKTHSSLIKSQTIKIKIKKLIDQTKGNMLNAFRNDWCKYDRIGCI